MNLKKQNVQLEVLGIVVMTKLNLNEKIFKAYDIRGVYDSQLNSEVAKAIAIALSEIYPNEKKIIVGRDGRLSSEELSKSLVEGFISMGIDIIDIGLVPTPLLYYAVEEFKSSAGIMVTGSHNPKEYNGFKMIMSGAPRSGSEIKEIYNVCKNQKGNLTLKNGNIISSDIQKKYLSDVLSKIQIKKKLKIAIDAGNGAAGPIAFELYNKLGCEVIPLYCDIDGNFPNHHPNPSEESNLEDLKTAVLKNKCDLGLAFDGDGDRCLIVDDCGNSLWPDKQMMIFSTSILKHHPNAKIIYDVKSSNNLHKIIEENSGIPLICRTGHSFIKKKMKEEKAILGGEMSGHIFFKDKWFGFDDGIYAGARMIEIISEISETSSQFFGKLPNSFSTPEINIPVSEEGEQHKIIELFSAKCNFEGARISKIDGVRADYSFGWGIIRASNTTPNIVARFEANTHKELSVIKNNFYNQLKKISPDLNYE